MVSSCFGEDYLGFPTYSIMSSQYDIKEETIAVMRVLFNNENEPSNWKFLLKLIKKCQKMFLGEKNKLMGHIR